MKIIQKRGDTQPYKFPRKDEQGNPILIEADEVYFTVKSSVNNRNAVLQKTIDDMTFNSETGYYSFTIYPEDTDGLSAGSYVYDIEVIVRAENYKRTISEGEFIITADVTRPNNEVSV